MLPKGTAEVLWIHPFGLDYTEVLSRIKSKNYERLLAAEDDLPSIRSVSCLPYVDQAKSERSILEYSMLVSSIDFDLEAG